MKASKPSNSCLTHRDVGTKGDSQARSHVPHFSWQMKNLSGHSLSHREKTIKRQREWRLWSRNQTTSSHWVHRPITDPWKLSSSCRQIPLVIRHSIAKIIKSFGKTESELLEIKIIIRVYLQATGQQKYRSKLQKATRSVPLNNTQP